MFLETQRLRLRDFEPGDFEDVHAYSSDYENVRHMMFGPNTLEQTRDYLEVQCPAQRLAEPRMHYNFALELRDCGRVIGGISLHLNWRRDDAVLGIIINRRSEGCGYTTEALRGVLEIGFHQLGLHRIHAVCDTANIAVQRIFEKLGMRNEGTMRQRGKSRPEEPQPYFDQFGYAILASEWNVHNSESCQ